MENVDDLMMMALVVVMDCLSRTSTHIDVKIFTQGVVWNVNPFDQWGVELGKEIGKQVFAVMQGDDEGAALDAGTLSLVALWKSANG